MKGPTLLISTPIEDRLEKVESRIAEHLTWEDESSPSVKTARWILAEVRDAIKEAGEVWLPTRDVARLTGWDIETLTRNAHRKLDGDPVPPRWRMMECRRDGIGYLFRVSTLPPNGAQP